MSPEDGKGGWPYSGSVVGVERLGLCTEEAVAKGRFRKGPFVFLAVLVDAFGKVLQAFFASKKGWGGFEAGHFQHLSPAIDPVVA